MAIAEPLILNDSSAVAQTFTRQNSSKDESVYVENDAVANDIRTITFRHQNAGPSVVKGQKPIRRHSMLVKHEKWNSVALKTEVFSINCSILIDPASGVSLTAQKDVRAFLVNGLTEALLAQLCRDET